MVTPVDAQRVFLFLCMEGNVICWELELPILLVSQSVSSVAQSCPTLCDPMDRSLPGTSVHGDSPGKDTGLIAIRSLRDLPHPGIEPRSPALQVESLPTELPGKLLYSLLG